MTTHAPSPQPVVEVRLPVDGSEPFVYDHEDGTIAIEIAVAGGGILTLHLDHDHAREWAAALDGAVIVAHRELVPDPHGLDDWIIDQLANPNRYDPASTLRLTGTEDEPARMTFTIHVVIRGLSLDDARLRTALVTTLTSEFNIEHVVVSNGHPAT